jgi:hypothetical protein
MTRDPAIPEIHQVLAEAAVKAILGDRAVIREMAEVPAPSAIKRAGALKYGIRTFWRRWTARQSTGSSTTNETPD